MKVYKVVWNRIDGRLGSVVMCSTAEVIYTPNEWAVAPKEAQEKGYHLTAFESEISALGFFGDIGADGLSLYEAEAEDIVEELPPLCEIPWVDTYLRFDPDRVNQWPPGTVMCKRLKLTEKVA